MKKPNLPYRTYLLRVLTIMCLLSSYLWVAPSQVHALSAGSQDDVLGRGEHLRSTGPLQTGGLSLSISKGGVPQAPGESNPSAPRQQGPTLAVDIISSPWATLDNTTPSSGPRVFVVEAVITNTTDITTATNVVVTLDYNEDPANGWVLLDGEDEERTVGTLAPGAAYHAYWFASYPITETLGHQYTVAVEADGIVPIVTSENSYDPNPDRTVQTRKANSVGMSRLVHAEAEVVVGVAFTVTAVYDLGVNPSAAIFSPVGNFDFDPGAYRLMSTEVDLYSTDIYGNRIDDLLTATDRLYLPLPGWPSTDVGAEVIYTFIALRPSNAQLCPYAVAEPSTGQKAKYDQFYCSEDTAVSITGTLTLSQTKQASSLIEQGQFLTYTINYTNTGDKTLQWAWIWDDIPDTLASIVTDSITPTPAVTTDSRVAWDLGTIPPTSTYTLTFAVLVDGDGQDLGDDTSLVNHAYFGFSPGTSLPTNAVLSSTVATTIQAPMIALSKTDGQDTAEPGDALVYTLRITNSGSVAATGVVITDELPSGVSYTNYTATPPETSRAGQTLVWNNQNVPAGGALVLTIPVTVNSDVPDETTITNTATVIYKNASGQHTFAAKMATDTTAVQKPVLVFTKTAEDVDGGDLVVGDEVLYTLQVINTGTYTAYNVTVTDDLPDQVTCVDVSDDSAPVDCADPLEWSISSLAADATASLYITVTIEPGSEGQTITNTASVIGENVPDPPDDPDPVCPDGSQPDPVSGECSTTPDPLDTELSITKTAEDVDGGDLVVGDEVLYTLQVSNVGDYTAYDVTVTDDLPDQVTCVDVSDDSAPVDCADPLEWNIPSLAADATVSLYITVTINPGSEGQTITNTASVVGENVPDPPDDPPPICPDGSIPVGDLCPTPEPAPVGGGIYLPIILRNHP